MISLRHAAKRGCRQLSSRRTYATSRQKRALNEDQLGKNAPGGPPAEGGTAAPAAEAATSSSSGGGGGGSSSLPAILALVAAGGAGAYYMDIIPGMPSEATETPSETLPVASKPKEEAAKQSVTKESAPALKKETKQGESKKEVEQKKEKAVEIKSKAETTAKATGNRVLNISLPPGSKRSAPPATVTEHPSGGNKVSMVPQSESKSKENAPSVDAALQELQRQISKDDSARSLEEARQDLAKLASLDLHDLDQMSITQLKIRLVQMAKDMEERTKWEAVRLKEFLAMKEKEVEDK